MASLTSSSWTITGANASLPNGIDTVITPRKKFVMVKLTMASGEWPSAGVTMPGAGSLGLVRNLDFYDMAPRLATASGKIIVFSLTTGNKMKVHTNALMSGTGRSIQALATTITVGSKIFYATAVGW